MNCPNCGAPLIVGSGAEMCQTCWATKLQAGGRRVLNAADAYLDSVNADNAWQAALVAAYGPKVASDARYDRRGTDTPELLALKLAKVAADDWRRAMAFRDARAHVESSELNELADKLLARFVVMPSGTPVWQFPAWICSHCGRDAEVEPGCPEPLARHGKVD